MCARQDVLDGIRTDGTAEYPFLEQSTSVNVLGKKALFLAGFRRKTLCLVIFWEKNTSFALPLRFRFRPGIVVALMGLRLRDGCGPRRRPTVNQGICLGGFALVAAGLSLD